MDANRYGDQKVNLKAHKGQVNKTSGNVYLERDVVITAEGGSQLKTDSLNWEKEKDIVHTNDPVTLTDENGMEATGKGLTAQPGLSKAKLNRDVTVKVKTEPKKAESNTLTITCDGPLEINQKDSVAIFNENVVASQEDRVLKADVMEVYFDQENEQIKKVVCIGHVEITQGENVSYAEKAVYDAMEQRVVMTGRPKLIFVTAGDNNIFE